MEYIRSLNLDIFIILFIMPFAVTITTEYCLDKYKEAAKLKRTDSWNSIKTAMSEMH